MTRAEADYVSDNGFVIVQIYCSVIQGLHIFMEIMAFNGGHGGGNSL